MNDRMAAERGIMGIGVLTAPATQVDYRGYEASGNAKIDAFYANLSSAVEKSETKGSEKLLGLTMIPYSDLENYGMKATYSESSTEEDPVICVSSNYGGENRSYDVHVNQVNPRNASQLEMFALCCYQDDKGITEKGTFGSYARMKVYAANASDQGGFPNLEDPENAGTKMDWITMLQDMSQMYYGIPEAYSQGLDANKLADALAKWKETIFDKVMNGETEEKIQIGGQSLTQKEWDQMLEKFDTAEEVIKEAVKEETEQKIEDAKKKEMLEEDNSEKDNLKKDNLDNDNLEKASEEKSAGEINEKVLY